MITEGNYGEQYQLQFKEFRYGMDMTTWMYLLINVVVCHIQAGLWNVDHGTVAKLIQLFETCR